MKDRVNIHIILRAFICDPHFIPNNRLWQDLLSHERTLHPIDIGEAKLKPWGIYPGDLSTMWQVIAIWLRFELNTYPPGETEARQCVNDGVIDESYEINKRDLALLLKARKLPLPRGLFQKDESLEQLAKKVRSSGGTDVDIACEVLKRDPFVTNYRLGRLATEDKNTHVQDDTYRKRGQRLKSKIHKQNLI